MSNNRATAFGFTLIELMIAIAIVAIIAAIAYPSYVNYVREARRAEAQSALLDAANRQERFYTSAYRYSNQLEDELGVPSETENGFYQLAVTTQTDPPRFELTATPTEDTDQVNDDCGTLRLTQTGQKSADGNDCW